MPTLLDSFVLELGWDTKPLEKGRKEAESNIAKTKSAFTKAGKEMEDSAKAVATGISKVATEILALYAVITGASSLKGFITDLISANTQLGNFATTIGDSPQAIDAWGKAAERVGGNASATAGSFQRIADALNALRTQGQALPLAFYQLMAAANTPIDTSHGPVAFMEGLARATRVLARTDPAKAAFYLKSIGIDQGTIALMLQGGPALDAYVKSLEKLAPTPAQIQASKDLLAAWTTLSQTAVSLGNQILPTLDRILTPVLDSWAKWIDQNRDLINLKVDEMLKKLVDTLQQVDWQKVIGGFSGVANAANNIATAINSIVDGIKWLNSLDEASKKWMPEGGLFTNPTGTKPGDKPSAPLQGGGIAPGGNTSPSAIHRFPGKASGGPVSSGGTYLIGEKGPELLHLGNQGGGITPNSALSGDLQIQGRPVDRGNPVPIALVAMGNNIADTYFGGSANLGYLPGGGMGSGGGGLPRHPGSGPGAGDAGAAARATAPLGASALKGSSAELVSYIRESAIKHGIDPDIALRVARSEGGLSNPYRHGEGPAPRRQLRSLGPTENSYGPFQLWISGTGAGLGDRALKAGVDPRTNWKAGIDFALDEVRRKGWGQWFGAQHQGITGMRGVGPLPSHQLPSGAGAAAKARGGGGAGGVPQKTSSISNETNVNGPITIHTQARDARGIAVALSDQIRRTTMTSTANYGPA